MSSRAKVVPLLLSLAIVAAACVDGEDESDDAAMDGSTGDGDGDGEGEALPDLPAEGVTWAEVSAIIEDRECAGCHGVIPETYESVVANWLEGPEGNVLQGKMEISHRVNAADAAVVLAWIEAGYPEM